MGHGVTTDLTAALSHYYHAATQGNITAHYAYALGETLTHAPIEARKWYQQAANQGHVDSMCRLGELYYHGKQEVVQNRTQAVRWFRKAAEHGNASGQPWLGRCYYEGIGGLSEDHTQADKWFKQAARQHQGARTALDLINQLSMAKTKDSTRTSIEEARKLRDQLLQWEGF